MSGIELVRLTSPWVVWPAVAVTLVTIGLTARRWRRAGRTGWVVGTTVAAVASAALVVDQAGSFYPTIGSLLAISPPVLAPPSVAPVPTADTARRGRLEKLDGIGVYLPAGYDEDPADLRYPVVEWRAGHPGRALSARLDAAVGARQLPPVVVLFPHGSADLHAWAAARLRVRTDARAWLLVDGAGAAPAAGTGTAAGPDIAATLAWLGANLPDPVRTTAGAAGAPR